MFGCIAYVHVPDEKRSKLDPKTEKRIFIGYSLKQKGYRCFNPSTWNLQVNRNVVFDEMVNWYSPLKVAEDGEARNGDVSSNVEQESQLISGPQESSISGSSSTPWKGKLKSSNIVHGSSQTLSKNLHVDDESSDSKKSVGEESQIISITTLGTLMAKKALKTPDNNSGIQRSTRVKYPIQILTYDGFVANHYTYMVKVIHEFEPTCFEQTVGNPKWDNAMDEEMAALDVHATWELVALPKDKKAIGCKWVYKIKHNANGFVSRYKARLVAKGYAQTYGIDYEETCSPVAKMTTVKIIIAMAATKGWSLHQMDVNNVFLHGDLHEEVYMEQPPGYVDQTQPNLVCRLKKTLYGLKQAPKSWSNKTGQYLVTSGFQKSNANFSLYVKKTNHGIVIIVIYVDDLIITRNNDVDIFDLKKLLKQKFEMKDLGKLRYFLGIEVIQSPKGIWLLQRQYALNKLTEYGMTGCKPISIPLEQNVKLSANEGNLVEDTTMYRCIVGSLIYMTITRSYLSYAVGVMSQFMQTPRKPHLDVVRHILRYIKHTLQCGIFYEAKSQLQVHGYTDANWAAMFQIKDGPMVSCFFLEVVLLIGVVRNNQQLHYQAQKQNTEVQQLLHVK